MKTFSWPNCRAAARGASATEYLMVLALVVIPLALLSPMILSMINFYLTRITTMIRMPLG